MATGEGPSAKVGVMHILTSKTRDQRDIDSRRRALSKENGLFLLPSWTASQTIATSSRQAAKAGGSKPDPYKEGFWDSVPGLRGLEHTRQGAGPFCMPILAHNPTSIDIMDII
jgi:hypothetical protein